MKEYRKGEGLGLNLFLSSLVLGPPAHLSLPHGQSINNREDLRETQFLAADFFFAVLADQDHMKRTRPDKKLLPLPERKSLSR